MKLQRTGLSIIFIAAILGTMLLPRQGWWPLVGVYTVAFCIYAIVVRSPQISAQWKYWVGLGIAARLIVIFVFPNLSDDIYRFIWDGHLTLGGINPYIYPPVELAGTDHGIRALTPDLFEALNSQMYYSIYPPVDQAIFALSSLIGGSNWWLSSIMLKLAIFSAEVATLWMMVRILVQRGSPQLVLLYALNPLVIIELTGNIHFEAFMILGVVASWYFLRRQQALGVAGGLAIGIGAKLLPLILVPFLIRRLPIKRLVTVLLTLVTITLIILLPMLLAGVGPGKSIHLYFQSFEFNASFYYIARWFGYQSTGYNEIAVIGPVMAGLTVAYLSALWLLERKPDIKNFPQIALWALTGYFLLATTVHPWYICPLVALSVFTNWRFPVIWSALVFLSYSAYQSASYTENLWLIGMEYSVLLAWIAYELVWFRKAGKNIRSEKT